MLRGVFQRAVVAILLMGTMLAPSGMCLQTSHKAAHNCCSRVSSSHPSFRKDCCITSAPLPAVVVAPSLPGSASMPAAREFALLDEIAFSSEFPALSFTPPHSPPPGAFILRI
jgi:hypothetical protein